MTTSCTARRVVVLKLSVLVIALFPAHLAQVAGTPSTFSSTRVVYYLHTTPATWNEASTTCSRYDATLVTWARYSATANNLQYVNDNHWGGALDGLTFWAGLYRNSTGQLRWQRCADHNATALPQVESPPSLSSPSCYAADSDFSLYPQQCSYKLPYICQRYDGQCWFQPYISSTIVDDDDAHSHTRTTTAPDEGECARLCRSEVKDGRECWAFVFPRDTGSTTGDLSCVLQFTDLQHKYALDVGLDSFQEKDGSTTYVKICTGGWTTNLQPAVSDSSSVAKDENCTAVAASEWDDSVCYCECDEPPVILQAETLVMTIEEKVQQIVQELHVDPKNTSNTRRKKISIEDSRPSAQGIGYLGISLLVIIFGGIFLLDINVLFTHVSKLCRALKGKGSDQTDC